MKTYDHEQRFQSQPGLNLRFVHRSGLQCCKAARTIAGKQAKQVGARWRHLFGATTSATLFTIILGPELAIAGAYSTAAVVLEIIAFKRTDLPAVHHPADRRDLPSLYGGFIG